MKRKRKSPSCLNCGHILAKDDEFCSKCGQENTDSNLPISMLIQDFFANTLAFDSKFFNSIGPFLFQPGYLSRIHKAGKRADYVNPLRIYLVVSVLFFFMLSMSIKRDMNFGGSNKKNEDDSLKVALNQQKDSVLNAVNIQDPSSKNNNKKKKKNSTIIEVDVDTANMVIPKNKNFLSNHNFSMINKYGKDEKVTEQMLLDSMFHENEFQVYLIKQYRKVKQKDDEVFASFVLKNIPVMMFLLIPIFAMTLKLLYIRDRSFLYINHVIHGVHLHTFSFLAYLFAMLWAYYATNPQGYEWALAFGAATVYSYVSFRRFYGQGWFKTMVKFLITGYIYIICITIFLMAELFISFLLF